MEFLFRKTLPLMLISSVCILGSSRAVADNSNDPISHIGPPAVSVTDRLGVNLTSGVMTHSVTDVTIGGVRGLTHRISTSGGTLTVERPQNRGFQDSFFGTISGGERKKDTSDLSDDVDILTVSDGSETVIFLINGELGSHTFTEIRGAATSTRNKLTQPSSSLAVWVKADGTEVLYHTYGWLTRGYGTKARMTSITNPNGFSIHIDYGYQYQITSVSTNTGYQLKYIYEDDNRSITSAQQNYIETTTLGEPYLHNSLHWSQDVPKYIVALNNAQATCNLTSTTCTYNSHWPKATYEWPAGMPRVAFLPEPVDFTVKDAENRATTFIMRGFDIAVPDSGFSSGYLFNQLPNEESVSRIIKVTPPSGKALEYEYENSPELIYAASYGYGYIHGYVRHSLLTKARRGNDELLYFLDINNAQGDMNQYRSQGYQSMSSGLYYHRASERIGWFTNWDMRVDYTLANEIFRIHNFIGNTATEYDYDARGNTTKVTELKAIGSSDNLISSATYAGSCGDSNQKYCNKPRTTTDPNGNITNYTYHAPSGNVETVTLPPDKHGERTKTIYSYQQYTASHNGGYSSPIWLLSQKSTCASTQTCPVAEQIITTYEYEPNNLHLVGEVISADGKSLRTCYEYDVYGNQVTVLPPKDNTNKSTCIN